MSNTNPTPYCGTCGSCGYADCCGVTRFLEAHVKGKTGCQNEAQILDDIIYYLDKDRMGSSVTIDHIVAAVENVIPAIDVDEWPKEMWRYHGELRGRLMVAYDVKMTLHRLTKGD